MRDLNIDTLDQTKDTMNYLFARIAPKLLNMGNIKCLIIITFSVM